MNLQSSGGPDASSPKRFIYSDLRPFQCPKCGRHYGRQDVLGRHLRLHTRNDRSEAQQLNLEGSSNDPTSAQATLSSISTERATFPPPTDPLRQHNFAESNALLESGNLLEWLMSDIDRASVVPLPLLDVPPGSSTRIDIFAYPHSDLETEAYEAPGNTALNQIYRMVDDLSKRLNSDIHSSGFTSTFLDSCLQEFFTRILPNFPVIHKQTFSPQKTIPPLLLNMVALGSLFVCEKDSVEKGEMLWRLGHTTAATSWQTLVEIKGPWDSCDGIQLVLTALLGQTYALVSKNPDFRTTASVFHGLGFYWARSSGMYSVQDVLSKNPPRIDMPEREKDILWKTWAASEVQRRAILGHYILDGLISQASGSPASASHLINSLGTACSDAAFSAETADEWIVEINRSEQSQLPVSEAFVRIFAIDYGVNPLRLSRFSTFVIIEGLQSLVSDLHEVQGPVFGTVSQEQIIQAMLNLYQGNIASTTAQSEGQDLPTLLRWHSVFIEITAPSILIYRCLCNRYQLPQVLGGIHAKSRLDDIDLNQWVMKKDAYKAVLHAISITRLLEHLPLSQVYMIHVPTAIFASAMVLAIICILNRNVIEIPEKNIWIDIWKKHTIPRTGQTSSTDTSEPEDMFGYPDHINQTKSMTANLLELMNSLHVILTTVASRWGTSAQMGDIIGRLVIIAREKHNHANFSNI
ncbi:hypothetical protein N7478_006774 [Penicillium angulare]|uniref:uncharacterized protein n=1 Tax=Penicillium angulare TaxID=116970 RepID=UPI002541F82A|nr:uncharacterized protein N7478_006774 [Penicillium angulare]KAJ5281402.1 hypothetical protein N7478_006774 [Penicillium angulare]